jgi:hypothetical protein
LVRTIIQRRGAEYDDAIRYARFADAAAEAAEAWERAGSYQEARQALAQTPVAAGLSPGVYGFVEVRLPERVVELLGLGPRRAVEYAWIHARINPDPVWDISELIIEEIDRIIEEVLNSYQERGKEIPEEVWEEIVNMRKKRDEVRREIEQEGVEWHHMTPGDWTDFLATREIPRQAVTAAEPSAAGQAAEGGGILARIWEGVKAIARAVGYVIRIIFFGGG